MSTRTYLTNKSVQAASGALIVLVALVSLVLGLAGL